MEEQGYHHAKRHSGGWRKCCVVTILHKEKKMNVDGYARHGIIILGKNNIHNAKYNDAVCVYVCFFSVHNLIVSQKFP